MRAVLVIILLREAQAGNNHWKWPRGFPDRMPATCPHAVATSLLPHPGSPRQWPSTSPRRLRKGEERCSPFSCNGQYSAPAPRCSVLRCNTACGGSWVYSAIPCPDQGRHTCTGHPPHSIPAACPRPECCHCWSPRTIRHHREGGPRDWSTCFFAEADKKEGNHGS